MARVLVIDDEPDVLLLCRVNLEHAGQEVLEASDGEVALEMIRTERPDLIVLDLMLPKVDGLTILALLGAGKDTREIPVVVLTAKAQREDQLRCWRAGAAAFLAKPFAPEDLATTVRSVLSTSPKGLAMMRQDALRVLGDAG